MFDYHANGIKLPDISLFLDAHRVVPFSFISHGHSDHLRNHKKIIATPATLRFFQLRYKLRIKNPETICLDFLTPYPIQDFTITLYPAGHILGSAMILIEKDGIRLLYTGDFKLQPGYTCQPIQIPEADILLMESTYGNPQYRFNHERCEFLSRLEEWIHETRQTGNLPVVLAYALGKAQEAMFMLSEQGYRVLVHPAAWEFAKIYQDFGIRFSSCYPFENRIDPVQDVLIIPPHHYKKLLLETPLPMRSIFLSGWAKASNPWIRTDKSLPFSDHADFDELMTFVKKVDPQKIYTLHGFAEFPSFLKKAGYQAEFLQK